MVVVVLAGKGRVFTLTPITDQADDWFILLNTSNLGQGWHYKAPRGNEPLVDVNATTWTVGDEPLQPYTPANLQVSEDDQTNDVTLSATPRTRRCGALGGPNGITDGVGSPGSEVTGYRFEILDDQDQVLRPADQATPSLLYTAAQQIADHGSLPLAIRWRVAPIGSLVSGVTRYSRQMQWTRVWTPDLIGVDAWFDASDGASLTLNGNAVTQWADKGGWGGDRLEQATAASRPTVVTGGLNGLDVLSFDGTDDFLRFTALYNSLTRAVPGVTAIAVHNVVTPPAEAKGLIWLPTALGGHSRFFMNIVNGVRSVGGRRLDTDAYQVVDSAVAPGVGYNVACGWVDYQNSDAEYWLDGSSIASTTAFQTDGLTDNTDGYYDTNNGGASVGCLYSGGTIYGPLHMGLAELLVFRTALSAGDRQKVEGYLAHKWGLQAQLPAGHPYKASAP